MEMTNDISRDRQRGIYRITLAGSAVNLALLAFKFAAGILGRSSAMIADAVHSLSDFVTDLIVLVFVRISGKPQDKGHDYGHGKYETLATALIGGILFFVGAGICWKGGVSIWKFLHGESLEAPGTVALIAALVSIAAKEGLYHYTVRAGRRLNSQAVTANAWHHRSDALSSVGTAAGIAGAILLGERGRVLDPAAAVIVSLLIMKVAVQLLIPSLQDLLEKSLPESVEADIERIILESPEVSQPHNLRTRRIGNTCAVEVHVRMDGEMTVRRSHEITVGMERRLKELLGPDAFINIHVEPEKH